VPQTRLAVPAVVPRRALFLAGKSCVTKPGGGFRWQARPDPTVVQHIRWSNQLTGSTRERRSTVTALQGTTAAGEVAPAAFVVRPGPCHPAARPLLRIIGAVSVIIGIVLVDVPDLAGLRRRPRQPLRRQLGHPRPRANVLVRDLGLADPLVVPVPALPGRPAPRRPRHLLPHGPGPGDGGPC